MVKDIQVTIYEILGYLLPGLAFLMALVVLFWALFLPRQTAGFSGLSSGELWAALGAAYVAGHVAQALGNLLERAFGRNEDLVLGKDGELPARLKAAIRVKVKQTLHLDADELPPRWFYRLCDDALVHAGKAGDREVYVYREGFYRGMSVGVGSLAIAVTALAVRLRFGVSNRVLRVSEWGWGLGSEHLTFFAVCSGMSSWLLYRRYRRFASYRITHVMLGYLTVHGAKKADQDSSSANP